MKYLLMIALLELIACEKKKGESNQNLSQVQELTIHSVSEEANSKNTKGEICDLHDDEERETYRIFLVSDAERDQVKFFRVNDKEDLAYPGLRTANLDLMDMVKASESDNFRHVVLNEKIYS